MTQTEEKRTNGVIKCVNRYIEKYQQDSFLAVVDQRPELDDQLGQTAEMLVKYEQRIRTRFDELLTQLDTSVKQAVGELQVCKQRLDFSFNSLTLPDVSLEQLDELARLIESELLLFNRRIYPRVVLGINRLHPRHKFLVEMIEGLMKFHQDTVQALPEKLILRFSKNKNPLHAGNSLFERECVPFIEQTCNLSGFKRWKINSKRKWLKKHYWHVDVPLREMAMEWLIEHNSFDVEKVYQVYQDTHEENEQELQDTARSVRFNLESAIAELDEMCGNKTEETGFEKISELHQLVISSMAHTIEVLESFKQGYASVFDGIMVTIINEHHNDLSTIRKAVEDVGSFRGRWRWNRRLMRRSMEGYVSTAVLSVKTHTKSLGQLLQSQAGHIRSKVMSVQDALGLAEVAETERLRITDMPTSEELKQHAAEMPALYKRMFSIRPLISDEFLVGMEEQRVLLKQVLARWKDGYAANIAIVGHEGSGKTSLLNCFEGELDTDVTLWRYELHKRLHTRDDVLRTLAELFELETVPASVPEMVQVLLVLPRGIVRFEHGHMMYLRAIGAREAIEAFIHIMMRTREHLLWMVTYRQYPWNRLQYLFSADDYFTHVVNTNFRKREVLREAIERRQRATNLELIYDLSENRSRKIKKLSLIHDQHSETLQDALSNEYFDTLYKVTGGIMKTALISWLQSISFDDKGRVRVAQCRELDERFITELNSHQLLTLSEIIGHGGLSSEEHSEIFRMSNEQSRLVLDYLSEIRLLEGRIHDQYGQLSYYVLNPVFQYPVMRVLKNMNILH